MERVILRSADPIKDEMAYSAPFVPPPSLPSILTDRSGPSVLGFGLGPTTYGPSMPLVNRMNLSGQTVNLNFRRAGKSVAGNKADTPVSIPLLLERSEWENDETATTSQQYIFVRRAIDVPEPLPTTVHARTLSQMNSYLFHFRRLERNQTVESILKFWRPFGVLDVVKPIDRESRSSARVMDCNVIVGNRVRLFNYWMACKDLPLGFGMEGYYLWFVLRRITLRLEDKLIYTYPNGVKVGSENDLTDRPYKPEDNDVPLSYASATDALSALTQTLMKASEADESKYGPVPPLSPSSLPQPPPPSMNTQQTTRAVPPAAAVAAAVPAPKASSNSMLDQKFAGPQAPKKSVDIHTPATASSTAAAAAAPSANGSGGAGLYAAAQPANVTTVMSTQGSTVRSDADAKTNKDKEVKISTNGSHQTGAPFSRGSALAYRLGEDVEAQYENEKFRAKEKVAKRSGGQVEYYWRWEPYVTIDSDAPPQHMWYGGNEQRPWVGAYVCVGRCRSVNDGNLLKHQWVRDFAMPTLTREWMNTAKHIPTMDIHLHCMQQ